MILRKQTHVVHRRALGGGGAVTGAQASQVRFSARFYNNVQRSGKLHFSGNHCLCSKLLNSVGVLEALLLFCGALPWPWAVLCQPNTVLHLEEVTMVFEPPLLICLLPFFLNSQLQTDGKDEKLSRTNQTHAACLLASRHQRLFAASASHQFIAFT